MRRDGGSGRDSGKGGRSGGRSGAHQGSRTRGQDGGSPARVRSATRPKKPGSTTAQVALMAQAAKGSLPAPRPPSKAQIKAAAQQGLATRVQTLTGEPDEAGMRVGRFLVARFPQLAFTHIQRIVRKGELRVDGKRAKPQERLATGQKNRITPAP